MDWWIGGLMDGWETRGVAERRQSLFHKPRYGALSPTLPDSQLFDKVDDKVDDKGCDEGCDKGCDKGPEPDLLAQGL
jgi:hypothetical protein